MDLGTANCGLPADTVLTVTFICLLPNVTIKLSLQDMDYRGDVRQLLSLSEVHAGNISAGLIADIIAVVNPKATYRAAAENVSASSFGAVDGNSFVIIGADGARAMQLEAW